jgi:predicted nucleic acid-binding protein
VIVVDTSAAIAALAATPTMHELVTRLEGDGDLHAPHIIDVEVIHALRRLVAAGELTEDRAADVRSDFADLAIVRYAHHPLADRMWELRHGLSAHDAAFVALAEALDVPLLTCDGRLARAGGHHARIELF